MARQGHAGTRSSDVLCRSAGGRAGYAVTIAGYAVTIAGYAVTIAGYAVTIPGYAVTIAAASASPSSSIAVSRILNF
jgi:hypothetical protein